MDAFDVMTTSVVTVGPETPMRKIAELLLEHSISAVPVVDETGAVIGMVSEGDLLRDSAEDRLARRDWWLSMLAEGEPLSPQFLASLNGHRTARDIMSAPVVSVTEHTDITEIGKLLATHKIKRVPVIRDERIVGIVSRADLIRALAQQNPRRAKNSTRAGPFDWRTTTRTTRRRRIPAPRACIPQRNLQRVRFPHTRRGSHIEKGRRDRSEAQSRGQPPRVLRSRTPSITTSRTIIGAASCSKRGSPPATARASC